MCYTCGCKLPYEDHGDPNNITEAHLNKAGQTEAIGEEGIVRAKQNMMDLIELQRTAGEMDNPKENYNE